MEWPRSPLPAGRDTESSIMLSTHASESFSGYLGCTAKHKSLVIERDGGGQSRLFRSGASREGLDGESRPGEVGDARGVFPRGEHRRRIRSLVRIRDGGRVRNGEPA